MSGSNESQCDVMLLSQLRHFLDSLADHPQLHEAVFH